MSKYTVDIEQTMSYSDMYNEPSEYTGYKNYIKTFPKFYPKAYEFLKNFAVPFERPIETLDYFWNDTGDKIIYESYYSVKGELFEDKVVVYNDDARITLYKSDTQESIYGNTGMEKPYFILVIDNLELHWVMDTPYEEPDLKNKVKLLLKNIKKTLKK